MEMFSIIVAYDSKSLFFNYIHTVALIYFYYTSRLNYSLHAKIPRQRGAEKGRSQCGAEAQSIKYLKFRQLFVAFSIA